MEREYYIRGQRKAVEEIENLTTIKVNLKELEKKDLTTRGLNLRASSHVTGEDMPTDTLEAFEKANWLFLDSSEETARVAD